MRKRLCVLISGLHSEYAQLTMKGISAQANLLDYDVFVYSYYGFRGLGHNTMTGEENIMTLINPSEFDAFIVRKGSYPEKSTADWISEMCRQSGKPWIEIDEPDSENEEYPLWNEREYFRILTEHMLTEHNYRMIYCVTGFKGNSQAEERLLGYRDALLANGITPKAEWEFYGDFWYEHARRLADSIAAGELQKPEAIVFAGTVSAIGFIQRMQKHGYSVPKDIAVAGFDCYVESELCSPRITCFTPPCKRQGVCAVCRVHKLLTGESVIPVDIEKPSLLCNASCGCYLNDSRSAHYFHRMQLEQRQSLESFRNSGMQEMLSSAINLNEFADKIVNLHYLIRGVKKAWLCVCDDWDGINNTSGSEYRTSDYADKLYTYRHILDDSVLFDIHDKSELLDKISDTDKASTYYFFPLHYEDRCFGFICLNYHDNTYTPDGVLWSWLEMVNNAMEMMRIRYYLTRFRERTHLAIIRDPLTGMYNRRGFEEFSEEIFEHAVTCHERFVLIAVRICNLNEVNCKFGYSEGDNIIHRVAEILSESCTGNHVCCHVSPEMFYIVGSHDVSQDVRNFHSGKIIEYIQKKSPELAAVYGVEFDIGVYKNTIADNIVLSDIIKYLLDDMQQKYKSRQKLLVYFNNLDDLRTAIYESPEHKWTVDDMAKRMTLSRAYFQRMYKKKFGINVSADIICARIEKAKRLLLAGISIAETSLQCGYNTDAYFMQQFKKETGMTPSEFIHHEK